MKKYLGVILVIAMLCTSFLAACQTDDPPAPAQTAEQPAAQQPAEQPAQQPAAPSGGDERYTIGVVNVDTIHPYYRAMINGMEQMAERLDVDLVILDSQSDVGRQMANLEDLITLGVDAILLVNVGEADGGQAVDIANAAGIPIIAVSRECSGTQPLSSVVTDRYAATMFAEDMARLLGGEGVVLEVQGFLGVSNVTYRHEELAKVIEANPGLELAASVVGNFDPAENYSVTMDALAVHPNVTAIYVHDDASGEGAIRAVHDMNMQDQIKVFGTGGTPSAIQAIADGELFYTAALLTGWEGAVGVKLAVDHLNGLSIPAFVTTPVLGVTRENVAEVPGDTAWNQIDWPQFPFP